MKRLRTYLYTLFVFALPLQAQEGLVLEQLPPDFSLRTLSKMCHQSGLKRDLAERYTNSEGGVKAMQHKLRHELRFHMLARSLELEKKMAYFYAHQTFPSVYFPDSCPRLTTFNDSAWPAITAQQQAMRETEQHLSNTAALRWQGNMRVLLRASYEIMLIKHIFRRGRWNRPRSRNWQHPPYWSHDVGRIKQLAFPPIYPVALENMQFGYPRQRLEHLYEKFPLLRWRGMRKLDLLGKTLDHKIFELAFVNGHHEGVLQRLEFDFARKLRPLMTRVEEFSNNVGEIKIKTIKNKEIVLNKGQINNLRALQFYFMFEFDHDMEEYINNLTAETINDIARLVDRTYIDWVNEQQAVRNNACYGRDFEIEEYREVLWSLLNNYKKEDSLDLLAAFCHPSWGRTPVRLTEAWSQATYGALFGAGILIRKIRPTAVPIASLTAAFSFAMRSVRGVRSLQTERALLLLDIREENNRVYNNTFNVVAIPISIWGLNSAANAFTNDGWKFFVPFRDVKNIKDMKDIWRFILPFRKVKNGKTTENMKEIMLSLDFFTSFGVARYADAKSHLDRNINPLTSKNFMLNTLDNLLGASVKARALDNSDTMPRRFKNTAILSLTYALFNVYVQNMYFLFLRDDITIENHKFNNMWGVFHSAPRNVIDWTLWHHLYGKAKSSPLSTATNIVWLMNAARFLDSWQKKTWYANSKLSYLKEDKSFYEAFADLSLSEYRDPLKIDPSIDTETKVPSLKEIESLEALLRIYARQDEKIHLLINTDLMYQQNVE